MILTITKKYFDLIASGEKKIEYRKNILFYEKKFSVTPSIIVFHYRKGVYLKCDVDKIELIKRPAFLKNSIFISTKKCFAIHVKNPLVYRQRCNK